MRNITQLDVNLLLTLDVLLEERNVTRAARRLGLSQPSVSIQLARLRTFFGDPLLLPAPRGMQTTVRADGLREPLRGALRELERVVLPARPFEAATAELTWKVAASDYGALAIVAPSLDSFRSLAPKTRLALFQLKPVDLLSLLESGAIDLALHTLEGAPAGLRSRRLFREHYVLASRKGHPKLKRKPTLAQFCALEHVVVSNDGGGFVGATDKALARLGATRHVALSVPHFGSAMAALAQSELVAMLPARLLEGREDLQVVPAPLEVPGFEMVMIWHERVHRDPGHQWLRERLGQVARR